MAPALRHADRGALAALFVSVVASVAFAQSPPPPPPSPPPSPPPVGSCEKDELGFDFGTGTCIRGCQDTDGPPGQLECGGSTGPFFIDSFGKWYGWSAISANQVATVSVCYESTYVETTLSAYSSLLVNGQFVCPATVVDNRTEYDTTLASICTASYTQSVVLPRSEQGGPTGHYVLVRSVPPHGQIRVSVSCELSSPSAPPPSLPPPSQPPPPSPSPPPPPPSPSQPPQSPPSPPNPPPSPGAKSPTPPPFPPSSPPSPPPPFPPPGCGPGNYYLGREVITSTINVAAKRANTRILYSSFGECWAVLRFGENSDWYRAKVPEGFEAFHWDAEYAIVARPLPAFDSSNAANLGHFEVECLAEGDEVCDLPTVSTVTGAGITGLLDPDEEGVMELDEPPDALAVSERNQQQNQAVEIDDEVLRDVYTAIISICAFIILIMACAVAYAVRRWVTHKAAQPPIFADVVVAPYTQHQSQ
mmetsp:Transcript_28993/g.77984  ORF Transcript_28993/g.77984 Transcript_28993/m.77984 type:complete len:475 (+) Transcript_28993:104-1528(+)